MRKAGSVRVLRAMALAALAAALATAGCGPKVEETDRAEDRRVPAQEVSTQSPSVEVWVEYWPGGRKKEETEFRGGTKHGKSTLWYENGQVEWEGEYRDGEPVSYKHWTEDGRIIRTKR